MRWWKLAWASAVAIGLSNSKNAAAEDAPAAFWLTAFVHVGGLSTCDYRRGTIGTSVEGVCNECVTTVPAVTGLLGSHYRIVCVGTTVDAVAYNCTATCDECTEVLDDPSTCTAAAAADPVDGLAEFGLAVGGDVLLDNVCGAVKDNSADSSVFAARFAGSASCGMGSGSHVEVRMLPSSTNGCTDDDYPGFFFDVKQDGTNSNGTKLYSGAVNCTEGCGVCGVNFTGLAAGGCISALPTSSFELVACPGASRSDNGPTYIAELLVVGIVVLVIGIVLILQSCRQLGGTPATLRIGLNSPENAPSPMEREPLIDRPYSRDERGRVTMVSVSPQSAAEIFRFRDADSRPGSRVEAAVSPDDIAAAVAAEKIACEQAAVAAVATSPPRNVQSMKI